MIKICPNCGARYTVMPHTGDFVHNCDIPGAKTAAHKEEDLVVVGPATDYSGSTTIGPQAVMMQGIQNEFWGTDAAIYGENYEGETRRGNSLGTHRTRSHLEYIEVKENGK